MKPHKRGIYIRRIRKGDVAEDLRTAYRMAYFQIMKWSSFGVFVHGRSRVCLVVEGSKRECKDCFMGGWEKAKKFWKRR